MINTDPTFTMGNSRYQRWMHL